MYEFKHILVPTDFGDASQCALDAALDIAARFGSKLTIVHATWLPPAVFDGDAQGRSAIASELAQESQQGIDAALAKAKGRHPDPKGIVATGETWEAILDAAKQHGADLIVMGTHGRRGLSRVFLGSVAERVVRLSPVPVLTVSTKHAAEARREVHADTAGGRKGTIL